MKFTIEQGEIADKLKIIAGVALTKTTMPILKQVLVEAKGGQVSLRATDTVVDLTLFVPVDIKEEGITAVDAEMLSAIVDTMAGEITFSLGTKLSIQTRGKKRTLAVCDPKEFPVFPAVEDPAIDGEWDVQDILNSYRAVSFAVAKDMSRPELTGVNFNFGLSRVLGGDGKRMAVQEIPPSDLEFSTTYTIRGLEVLNQVAVGMVRLKANAAWANISSDTFSVYMSALSIPYPRVAIQLAEALPARVTTTITANRNELMSTLNLAMLCADRAKMAAEPEAIIITCSGGKVHLSMAVSGLSEVDDVMEQATYDGGDVAIKVHPRLLSEDLGAVASSEVKIGIINADQPVVISSDGMEKWVCIQVPMVMRDEATKWEEAKKEIVEDVRDDSDF